jgi:hypothetical protein
MLQEEGRIRIEVEDFSSALHPGVSVTYLLVLAFGAIKCGFWLPSRVPASITRSGSQFCLFSSPEQTS